MIGDKREEVYDGIMGSSKGSINPELSEERVSPELSEEGEQVYLKIERFQNACYDMAKTTGKVYIDICGDTRYKIRSAGNEITEDVEKLPKEDRELITKKLKDDPKAYYSAERVIEGLPEVIIKKGVIESLLNRRKYIGLNLLNREMNIRIGDIDKLYKRVEAAINSERGRIAGPESYERAKEAWEEVESLENLEKLKEEEGKLWEKYFSEAGEKKEES